jgi:hypothetical protein
MLLLQLLLLGCIWQALTLSPQPLLLLRHT